MKLTSILLFLLGLGGLSPSQPIEQNNGQLRMQLENIQKAEGSLMIGIYEDKNAFEAKGKGLYGKIYKVENTGNAEIVIDDLPFGSYGVAIFHDLNDNQKLDKNLFGIPTEPYAFSNNPKVKWKAPSFEEVKFDFKEDLQLVKVSLKKWKEQ